MTSRLTNYATKTYLKFCVKTWPIITFGIIIGLLFYSLPYGFWRGDDTAILIHAIKSKGLSAFYDPNDWQNLSPSNLTPWVTLSFKIDLWLMGLSPKFFYIHQLCSLWIVAIASYLLNRLWLSPVWAFLCVCLFLVGAPTVTVTEQLMTRHYLEGMLFAFLSIIAFVYAIRQQQMKWAFISALAYAIAITAKEIYVPLILVVFLIPPVNSIKARLGLISPLVSIAILYVLWRHYMLGEMLGGYTDKSAILSFQSVVGMIEVAKNLPELFFGKTWQLPTILFCSTLAISFFKNIKIIPISIILIAGIIGPLIPLISFPGISSPNRYLFLFWYVACFAFITSIQFTTSLISKKKLVTYLIGISLFLPVLISSVFHTKKITQLRHIIYQEFDVQGRFFYTRGEKTGFIPTESLLNGYWYITSLCEIKELLKASCPEVIIKGVPLHNNIEELYAYDPKRMVMSNISSNIGKEIKNIESINMTRTLYVSMFLENGWIHWDLGPYENGQYYAASQKLGRYPISKKGHLKTSEKEISVYIQYESLDGWNTSSPLLITQENHPIIWKRPLLD